MRQAVLLLAHGAPERLEDIDPYLSFVMGGGTPPPQVVNEVRRRYAEIGGASPLLARTLEQAAALQERLRASSVEAAVYTGMRNWYPFIKEAMARIQADGVERIVALCLAPQYSKMSVGLYFRRVQEAKTALGMRAEIIWTKSFHDHPLLVEAFAEKLAPFPRDTKVLFTAHSLPEKILENADPYDAEARATARLVAAQCGLSNWDFAYQSQGMTADKWLGPDVESRIDQYAAEGVTEMVVAPVGFVSDHVETLYDVDVQFRRYAESRGIRLRRTESLNSSPAFIAALAAVASEKLRAN